MSSSGLLQAIMLPLECVSRVPGLPPKGLKMALEGCPRGIAQSAWRAPVLAFCPTILCCWAFTLKGQRPAPLTLLPHPSSLGPLLAPAHRMSLIRHAQHSVS
eukprot:8610555-Pyramimonas_sp.AAC.1